MNLEKVREASLYVWRQVRLSSVSDPVSRKNVRTTVRPKLRLVFQSPSRSFDGSRYATNVSWSAKTCGGGVQDLVTPFFLPFFFFIWVIPFRQTDD